MKPILKKSLYIPTMIYEGLPLFYIVVGVLLIMGVNIVTPYIIGWFLVAGGLLITKLRFDYRFFGVDEK